MLSRSQREKGGTEHVEIVSSVSPSTVVLLKAPLHLSTCWWLQQHCYFIAKSCLALLRTAGRQSLCPWDFPGENTGVGCHFLLQGIFLTQGSNPHLLHCSQTLYRLSYGGSILLPLENGQLAGLPETLVLLAPYLATCFLSLHQQL